MCKISLSLSESQLLYRLFQLESLCSFRMYSVEISGSSIHAVFTHLPDFPHTHRCPFCHTPCSHTKGTYIRHVHMLPIQCRELIFDIPVFRFHCENPQCKHKYFSEPLFGFAGRYSRRSLRMEGQFIHYVLEMSACKASRLLSGSGMPVSASTLDRHLLRHHFPKPSVSVCVGIDDLANRRGHTYFSVVVDQKNHKPVALLPSRASEEVTAWLDAHPQVNTVTRDGGLCFESGIRNASHPIIEVTDRFHLLQTLSHLIKEHVGNGYMDYIKGLTKQLEGNLPDKGTCYSILRDRLEQMGGNKGRIRLWEKLHQMKLQGCSFPEIHKSGGLSFLVTRNLLKERRRSSFYTKRQKDLSSSCLALAGYFSTHAHVDTGEIFRLTRRPRVSEIKYLYKGIVDYMHDAHKTGMVGISKGKNPLSILLKALYDRREPNNEIVSRFFNDDTREDMYELHSVVSQFKNLLEKGTNAYSLDQWIRIAEASSIEFIRRYAAGIKKEFNPVWQAVHSTLSNGLLEGTVNRIKSIKRQMYGRECLKLLTIKTIYARCG